MIYKYPLFIRNYPYLLLTPSQQLSTTCGHYDVVLIAQLQKGQVTACDHIPRGHIMRQALA